MAFEVSSISEMCAPFRGGPVMRVVAIDRFRNDPLVSGIEAAAPEGSGSIVYTVSVRDVGDGRKKGYLPVFVVLPIDQYLELINRPCPSKTS